ncbi:MAG: hypothetical protein L0Y66_01840 [Myxococcaceae bacterium]|nr:hypothetical protein [Myxococcaceae bacterium]MCI0673027.1 hypothetical protein [Myxococcaceae bacterium]
MHLHSMSARLLLGAFLAFHLACGGCGPDPVDISPLAEPTCTDGASNGDETGTDCGGPTCGACPDGQGCSQAGDCLSGACVSGVCAPASCQDGVQNLGETDVDCGGPSCQGCGAGDRCEDGPDCQSGVCAGGVCQAPSCQDGVRNGGESDADCGGADCPACVDGASCTRPGDCASSVCTGGVCQAPGCGDGVQNGAEEQVDCGGPACAPCVPADTRAPTVLSAFLPRQTVVRVRFSEPMNPASAGTGAANPAAYCVERTDGSPTDCTPTGDFILLSVQAVTADTFDLTLSAPPSDGSYTVLVTGVTDLAGNAVGTPNYADFSAGPLRVVAAQSASDTEVVLVFSRAVVTDEGEVGSATCTSPEACAGLYRLVGPTSLGDVRQAEVRPVPRENEVLLTHAVSQSGGNYTVIAANGRDGDGLNEPGGGAIRALDTGEALGAMPLDRATFAGLGLPIVHFGDGPLAADPFGDGSTFAYVFSYGDKVYVGPNRTGSRTVRMNADGTQVEDLGFSFEKDTNNAVGTRSLNSAPAPFPSVGSIGCSNNTYECGPDNEDGRGLFTSGVMGNQEWLVLSGSQSGGGLDYVYVTSETDATLNMQYVDITSVVSGTAKSFSAMGVFGDRAYLAFPDINGSKSPALVALLATPVDGLDTVGNGTNGNACDPAVHTACNLAANRMPGIGASGNPANSAPTVLVDFVAEHNGLLHLGNNGGLMRATEPAPRDYVSAPQDWAPIAPSHPAYAAHPGLTTNKTSDFTPADRAWSPLAVFRGRVYLGRNTPAGPQLWRCDPTLVAGPAPATAEACDAGDWTLVAANAAGTPTLTQFDNPANTRVTLLVVSGEHLYVGFDNAVDGVVVYRSTVEVPDTRADFEGEGCTADVSGCPGLGGNGFGAPELNRRLNDAVSLSFDGWSYLYVSVSDGSTSPVRLYRHRD